MKSTNHLIALYDASPLQGQFGHKTAASAWRTLAASIAQAGFGVVARVSTGTITAVLGSVHDERMDAIALSPAASKEEHMQAFRLPQMPVPTVYTGRGALGADVAAHESADAVVIIGSDDDSLAGILGCIGSTKHPIGILTDEEMQPLRDKVLRHYPHMIHHLCISNDPHTLMHELMSELRRRNFV